MKAFVAVSARAILADFPLLNLFIAGSANSEFVLGQLIAHKLDVGIISATYGHPMVGRRLVAADRLGAFVSTGHALAGKRDVALADLRDEPFVMTDPSGGFVVRDLTLQVCREAGKWWVLRCRSGGRARRTRWRWRSAGRRWRRPPPARAAVSPATTAHLPAPRRRTQRGD